MEKITEQKIYEIGYLLVPYLPAEEVANSVDSLIKAKIESLGGEVTSSVAPVMIRLAYTMTKILNNKHTNFSDAYFGALRFKLEAGSVKKLETDWQKEDDLVRFILISLPKGSELMTTPKKSFIARHEERKPFEIERIMPEKEEEKVAITAEELDKEIDKLVEPTV